MGGQRLVLIDPRCTVDSVARQFAAGARQVLESCVIYPSWSAFYQAEGSGMRIALTRRSGKSRSVENFKTYFSRLKKTKSPHLRQSIYLIFGPEADGLDAEDLGFATAICHLPTFGKFSSLNLAQAVLLALYILHDVVNPKARTKQMIGGEPVPHQPLYFPDQAIKDWLTAMGFNIQARKSSAYLTLLNLFMVKNPTRHQIQVLEAILQQNIRKLRQKRP